MNHIVGKDVKDIALGNVKCQEKSLNKVVSLKTSLCSGNHNRTDILSERLRFNKHVCIDKKPISINLNGATTISDIFDQNTNNFIPFEEIHRKYNISVFTYNQIKSCIKKDWKNTLKNGPPIKIQKEPYIFNSLKFIPLQKWTSQVLYAHLINQKIQLPTSFEK